MYNGESPLNVVCLYFVNILQKYMRNYIKGFQDDVGGLIYLPLPKPVIVCKAVSLILGPLINIFGPLMGPILRKRT